MPLSEREELELLELEEKEKGGGTPSQKVSAFEAGLRGVGQLGAAGFGDELEASVKAPVGAIKKIGSRLGLADSADPDIANYMQKLDEARKANTQAASDQPTAFYGAGAASGLARRAATGLPGMIAEGVLSGYGASESDSLAGQALDSSAGGVLGGVVGKLAEPIGGAIGAGLGRLGTTLKGAAESLAEKATGATGREAERFLPHAGRDLLDRGIVKFGSSPDDIAKAAEAEIETARKNVSGALGSLDRQGGKEAISSLDMADALEREIIKLRKDPGNGALVKQLEQRVESIKQGKDVMSLTEAEQVKRTFDARGYKNPDPDVNQADKLLGGLYRETVEDRAARINPDLARDFKDEKRLQQLLIPVRNASERRASTLNQSPLLGARDALGGAVGGAIGGIPGAIAGAAANRFLSPRLPAAGAVALDKVGDAATRIAQGIAQSGVPEQVAQRIGRTSLGQYMLNLAQNNPKEFLPKHYILMNTDPNYRKEYNGSDK